MWEIILETLTWNIWIKCNRRIFQNKMKSLDKNHERVRRKMTLYTREILKRVGIYNNLDHQLLRPVSRLDHSNLITTYRKTPIEPFLTQNLDETSKINSSRSTIEKIISNYYTNTIRLYAWNIVKDTNYLVEVLALRKGLKIIDNRREF